jgi:hypothetical protein
MTPGQVALARAAVASSPMQVVSMQAQQYQQLLSHQQTPQ